MFQKFMGLSKLIRILLLIIPGVNWIAELILRWSILLEKKDRDNGTLLVAVLTLFFGMFLGFVDAIFTYLYNKLALLELKL